MAWSGTLHLVERDELTRIYLDEDAEDAPADPEDDANSGSSDA